MSRENWRLVTYELVEFDNNKLKLETLEELPIILKESIKEYTSKE
jgi:hypothetical protein